ncbi:hypothetical protein [Chitinimonas koreensis]|uniref:hypothetical protein n=1 Tax=Chitinimonas koreensis TaxID=356302 RepID=UPI0003F80F30|nr:hypothetical protein [Chitinimonas koreensis]QNM96004.1 hypothetical protein H9L41_19625 [Chitinimonas koreensis]
MFRRLLPLAAACIASAVLAGPAEQLGPPPLRQGPPAPGRVPSAEKVQQRFMHREARIREALERGDISADEAAQLRQRLEARRSLVERWREREERLRREAEQQAPAAAPAAPQ